RSRPPGVHLAEGAVGRLLWPDAAVRELESSLLRLAAGAARSLPRSRLTLDAGALTVASAVDADLALAGSRTVASAATGTFAVLSPFGVGRAALVGGGGANPLIRLAAAGARARP